MNRFLSSRLGGASAAMFALVASVGSLRAVDGGLDAAYDAKLDNGIRFLAVQPDGSALISGDFRSVGGVGRTGVSRLSADGTLDRLYNPNSIAKGGPISLQADGTVFATDAGSHVVRINADGRANPTFNTNAAAVGGGTIHALAVQADGKILLGGDFNQVNGAVFTDGVARLNTDGTFDASFVSHAGFYSVKALAVLADGTFYAAGGNGSGSATHPTEMAHLSANGALLAAYDATPDVSQGSTAEISGLAVQTDGKVVVSGRFATIQGAARPGLARLNVDGTVDASFNPGTGPANFSTVLALLLQADGKVIVGGGFTRFNGVTRNRVARLNTDGSVDATFDPGAGAGSSSGEFNGALALALQPDGKLLVGGDFTTFGGASRVGLARLGGGGVVTPPTGKQPDISGSVADFKVKLNKAGTKTIIKGTLTLTNAGKKVATTITCNVYLSDDATLDATVDALLGTFSLADYGYLKLDKKTTVGPLAFRIPGPASLDAALHGKYIIVSLDVTGKNLDSDLSNNRIVIGPLP